MISPIDTIEFLRDNKILFPKLYWNIKRYICIFEDSVYYLRAAKYSIVHRSHRNWGNRKVFQLSQHITTEIGDITKHISKDYTNLIKKTSIRSVREEELYQYGQSIISLHIRLKTLRRNCKILKKRPRSYLRIGSVEIKNKVRTNLTDGIRELDQLITQLRNLLRVLSKTPKPSFDKNTAFIMSSRIPQGPRKLQED